MSHTVKIKAQFKTEHLSSFKRALEHFGWKFSENTTARTYPSDPASNTSYPLVGVNPNTGYDLGIQFNEKTGEIEVMYDPYGGSIAATLGQDLNKLKQEYACCVAEDHFAYMGWSATRETNENGEVIVTGEQG